MLEGVLRSVEIAETQFKALILWQGGPPFSAGANLFEAISALRSNRVELIEAMVEKFQRASLALKHCRVPTVAAVDGLALGAITRCPRMSLTWCPTCSATAWCCPTRRSPRGCRPTRSSGA